MQGSCQLQQGFVPQAAKLAGGVFLTIQQKSWRFYRNCRKDLGPSSMR
jgi:hypothetical protein